MVILKKKGFTLIEILVVMAIAAVLSSLAVNGYLQYRKSALIALSADNIVSQISALRGDTIYGIGAGDDGRVCRGIYLEKTAEGFLAKSFSQPFVGKKVWGGESAGWVYQGCGDFDALSEDLEFRDFELDEQVHIENIADALGNEFSEGLVLRFVPAKGDLEFRENFVDDFRTDFSKGEILRIKIQYGTGDDSNYQKDILFDFFNLKAHVD